MLGCPVIFQSWLHLPPDVQGIRMQAADIKELHRKGQFPVFHIDNSVLTERNNAQCLILHFRSSLEHVSSELKSLIKEGLQRCYETSAWYD